MGGIWSWALPAGGRWWADVWQLYRLYLHHLRAGSGRTGSHTPLPTHRQTTQESRRRHIFSISQEGFQQWHVVICKREGHPVGLCCLCVAACVFWKPSTHCFTSWQLQTAQTRHNIWKLSIVAPQQARAAQLIGRWRSGTLKQCTLREERDVRKGRKSC